MCFPTLFPRARGGMNVKVGDGPGERRRKIRPSEYNKYRLQNRDPRFRRDFEYLHVAHFFKLERQVEAGVYASLHLGKASAKLSKGDFVKKVKEGSEELAADLSVAFAAQKGTAEYWNKQRANLNTMDEELGPATWFVTLSCAEQEWMELRKYLLAANSDWKNVSKMSTHELCAKDPVTVSEFFHRRMLGFLDEVLIDHADGPLGMIDHFYWRLEYQARGAPHVHMKLWQRDAPVLGAEGVTEEQVLAHIQKYVTCSIPSLEENKELHDKVKKFQVHRCTPSCRRRRGQRGKGKGKKGSEEQGKEKEAAKDGKDSGKGAKKESWYCRYGFPRAVQDHPVLNGLEKTVKESAKGRGVAKLYGLRRTELERYVNDYNPAILLAWNANVDVQFVGESKLILNKYITANGQCYGVGANLPRYCNVCVVGSNDLYEHPDINDLAFIPAIKDGVVGCIADVGGFYSSARCDLAVPLDAWVPQDQIAALLNAVLCVFRDFGNRAGRQKCRLMWLIDEMGIEKFREEVASRMPDKELKSEGTSMVDTSKPRRDYFGVHEQKQEGLNFVGVNVPVGRMLAEDMFEMARIAKEYGDGEMRLTVEQNVVFGNVPTDKLEAFQAEPLFQKFHINPGMLSMGLVSCTGNQFCGFSNIETKAQAKNVTEQLEATLALSKPVRMHWTGCPTTCGQVQLADIGLMGTKPKHEEGQMVEAVDIFLGGAIGHEAAIGEVWKANVECTKLVPVLEELLIEKFDASRK